LGQRLNLAKLAKLAKHDRDVKDSSLIAKNAERLNREAADVLEYQDLAGQVQWPRQEYFCK
jgi:hypothetical protein